MKNQYQKLAAGEYHTDETRLNRGKLADYLTGTAQDARAKSQAKYNGDFEATKSMKFSSNVIHPMVLEPDTCAMVQAPMTPWHESKAMKTGSKEEQKCSECGDIIPAKTPNIANRSGKYCCVPCIALAAGAGDVISALAQQYDNVIAEKDYEIGETVCNSLRSTPFPGSAENCLQAFRSGDCELTGHASMGLDDYRFLVDSIRDDMIIDGRACDVILDLKFLKDISRGFIEKQIRYEPYFRMQPGMYSSLSEIIDGKPRRWFWICVKSTAVAPEAREHAVAVYEAPPALLEQGRRDTERATAMLRWCENHKLWPGENHVWQRDGYAALTPMLEYEPYGA